MKIEEIQAFKHDTISVIKTQTWYIMSFYTSDEIKELILNQGIIIYKIFIIH